jgi:hypothetical protein
LAGNLNFHRKYFSRQELLKNIGWLWRKIGGNLFAKLILNFRVRQYTFTSLSVSTPTSIYSTLAQTTQSSKKRVRSLNHQNIKEINNIIRLKENRFIVWFLSSFLLGIEWKIPFFAWISNAFPSTKFVIGLLKWNEFYKTYISGFPQNSQKCFVGNYSSLTIDPQPKIN